jgi:GAF domain-containing protein
VGLDGVSETGRDVAFCAYAIHADAVFVIPDAMADVRFADNPLVVGAPHIRAYAGAPLRTSDGFRLGTLCAIDRRPRAFTEEQLAMLSDLAHVVVGEMEQQRTLRSLALTEEQLAQRVGILEAILESAGEGILVADQHGRTIGDRRADRTAEPAHAARAARAAVGGGRARAAVHGGDRGHRPLQAGE